MTSSRELKTRAQECIDLALHGRPVDRPALLQMARAWQLFALEAEFLESAGAEGREKLAA